jgi:predicted Zn finger-like uncharacterized protein
MEIVCDHCKKKYRIDESKLPDKGVPYKCANCGNKFIIAKKTTIDGQKKVENECIDIRLFKAAFVFLFWVKSKERPKALRNIDKSTLEIYKKLKTHKTIVKIPDKRKIYEEINEFIKNKLVADKKINERKLLSYIKVVLKENSGSNIQKLFPVIMPFILDDKVISIEEKETLRILENEFELSSDYLRSIIDQYKKTKNYKKSIIRYSRAKKSAKEKILLTCAVLFGFVLLTFTAYGFYQYKISKAAFDGFNLQQYIDENPKLAFKKIHFSKYIIYGKPPGVNEKFEKLYIYHAKGNADFQFSLNNLKINEEQTDFVSKKLVLTCTMEFPIEVDVNIPQDEFNLIEELEAEPITKDEAAGVATAVAVPAGIAGSYLGTKMGASIGGTLFKVPLVGRLAGGAVGGLLGGGGAAAGAYVMTKNFLTGMRLENNSLGEQDKIQDIAKPLIALELMGGNFLMQKSWDKDIKNFYQIELKKSLNEIFKKYGWQKIEIEFKNFSQDEAV